MDARECGARGETTFLLACQSSLSAAFVQDLADLVPPKHLNQPYDFSTPLSWAVGSTSYRRFSEKVSIAKMLVVRVDPFTFSPHNPYNDWHGDDSEWPECGISEDCREIRKLSDWAKAELHGSHAPMLVFGCTVRDSHNFAPPQQSQLMKLGGNGHTYARMFIAQCLGVRMRSSVEVVRLRNAVSQWRMVEQWREERREWRRHRREMKKIGLLLLRVFGV